MIRWLGFVLIVSGAAAAGIQMATQVKHTVMLYQSLQFALICMKNEIRCNLTTLERATSLASQRLTTPLNQVFLDIASGIRRYPAENPGYRARVVLKSYSGLPEDLSALLCDLFGSLGRQDTAAQLHALELAESRVAAEMFRLRNERPERCRSYRTIGLCAGLALAVILI